MRPDLDLLHEAKRLLTEAIELPELAEAPSLFDIFASGEILTCRRAGLIRGLSSEQSRKRCVHTAEVGQPIGIRTDSIWLISKKRLLEDIEEYEGPYARLVAEDRARKLHLMWTSPPGITEID
jgi:hypothetical protein